MADHIDRLKAALADRYTVERELSSGGMATVYLAQNLKCHRVGKLPVSEAGRMLTRARAGGPDYPVVAELNGV